MRTADFDFELPEELIAQHAVERGESRLLALNANGTDHRYIRDLPEILQPGDLLVVNDTRVVPARVFGRRRPGGGRVEMLLTERHGPREWDAMVRPGRRMQPGAIVDLLSLDGDRRGGIHAEVVEVHADGQRRLRFSDNVEPYLEEHGHIPLPPYIRREDEADDRERYQTVFARQPGAVAAPTAGLHFNAELLEKLAQRGVEQTAVTLHVGLGTFKPVSADRVEDHSMHSERYEISEEAAAAIQRLRQRGGRLVAVGTTVVRVLESVAGADGRVAPGEGSTEIFITPGFRFQAVDLLLTNFHLPRSTLLMLVSALSGRERILDAYREAVARRYRFFSYGDAMLLERLPAALPPSRKADTISLSG